MPFGGPTDQFKVDYGDFDPAQIFASASATWHTDTVSPLRHM